MKIAFGLVVVAGIGIGLALPGARPAPRVAVAAVAAHGGEQAVPTRIERSASGHFLTVANVNDEPIRFVVDTGADTVALTLADARRAHVIFDPDQFQVVGKGAAGAVRGQEVRIADLALDGKHATDVRAVVLEDSDMSLLGQTFLRHIGTVTISDDTMTLQ